MFLDDVGQKFSQRSADKSGKRRFFLWLGWHGRMYLIGGHRAGDMGARTIWGKGISIVPEGEFQQRAAGRNSEVWNVQFCTDADLMDLYIIYHNMICMCINVYKYVCNYAYINIYIIMIMLIFMFVCDMYLSILSYVFLCQFARNALKHTYVSYSKVQQWMNLVAQVECSLAGTYRPWRWSFGLSMMIVLMTR